MSTDGRIRCYEAALALVLLAGCAAPPAVAADGKPPLDMPGLQLPDGAGFEVLGTPGRISGPDAAALQAMESGPDVRVEDDKDWVTFTPAGADPATGLIFYPGAECDVRGYAVSLRAIARAGHRVVVTRMPRTLAFLGTNRASQVMAAYPGVKRWVIAGHSMGGAAAAVFATNNPGSLDALILWDAYISKPADLSRSPVRVLLIHRATADGRPPESFARMAGLTPPGMQAVGIVGASHMQFGNFVAAPHRKDPPATISIGDQQSRIVAATLDFIGPPTTAAE